MDLTLLKKNLGDDQDMKLLTGTHKGMPVLMALSKNTGNIDMSLAVAHHLDCALKCLQNPDSVPIDAAQIADDMKICLLENTVTATVLLME